MLGCDAACIAVSFVLAPFPANGIASQNPWTRSSSSWWRSSMQSSSTHPLMRGSNPRTAAFSQSTSTTKKATQHLRYLRCTPRQRLRGCWRCSSWERVWIAWLLMERVRCALHVMLATPISCGWRWVRAHRWTASQRGVRLRDSLEVHAAPRRLVNEARPECGARKGCLRPKRGPWAIGEKRGCGPI